MAAENDLEVAHAPLQAKSRDAPRADEAEWVALLEGSDAGVVRRRGTRDVHHGEAQEFWRFGGADDRDLPVPVREPERNVILSAARDSHAPLVNPSMRSFAALRMRSGRSTRSSMTSLTYR